MHILENLHIKYNNAFEVFFSLETYLFYFFVLLFSLESFLFHHILHIRFLILILLMLRLINISHLEYGYTLFFNDVHYLKQDKV